MTTIALNQLERDVEDARERLSDDLERLRSPATLSAFKDNLWTEARESRDELVEKTKETANELVATTKDAARDHARRVFVNLRERAAANPAAALAIGAGLAWRIVHKPPIASMLVGAGLISLMRTNPQNPSVGAEMVSRAGDLAVAVKEKVEEWSSDAGDALSRAADAAQPVGEAVQHWSSDAAETIGQVVVTAKSMTDRGSDNIYHIMQDAEERDKYLLGAAAVAIVAAVGIASQRR